MILSSDDLKRLRATAEAATPGPWAWMGNQHGFYLATTHTGRQFVMGFQRMGMQRAQPVFRVGDRLVPAAALATFEVGDGKSVGFSQARGDDTVYRYDVNGFAAPDATFVAALDPNTALSLIKAAEREALAVSFIERLDCECDPARSTRECGRCVALASLREAR